jgi:hypothetical protein
MNTPCNLPYFETEIDKDGNLVNPSQVQNILDFLTKQGSTIKDLFVMSHGWNNDETDARSLYENFFTQFCGTLAQSAAPGVTAQQCAVVGILWPSKKFADASVTSGGAAGLAADPNLIAALDQLAAIVPEQAAQIQKAKALVPSLEDDPEAQKRFADAVRSLLPNANDKEEGVQHLFEMDGDDLLDQLSHPLPVASAGDDDGGGAASIGVIDSGDPEGSAQSLSSILAGIKGGAMRLLNYTTYYLMKDRAGQVGRGGVAQMLQNIQAAFPTLRIHLIGHSFGCRVVTSAAATITQPVASMTLLQAAFSHNSFSPDFDNTHQPGGFRGVVAQRKISGPLVISHTIKDTAVGLAYAIASRLARQNASAIGDANDPYGGLGRNGAQHTPEATDGDLQAVGSSYSFTAGNIANLKADTIIMEHSDIVHPEVAYALLTASGLSQARAAKA